MKIHESRIEATGGGRVERAETAGNSLVDGVVRSVQLSIDSQELARINGYDSVGEFSDGVAVARKGDLFFAVNTKGQRVDKKNYTDAGAKFSEGKLNVKDAKWHFIDKSGKNLKLGEFDEACPFYHGIAAVRNGAYWKFIKVDGSPLNGKSYSRVDDFEEGVGYGKRGNVWYKVNPDGTEEIPTYERLAA